MIYPTVNLPDDLKKELLTLNTSDFFLQLLCISYYFAMEGYIGLDDLMFEKLNCLYSKSDNVIDNYDFDEICNDFFKKLQDYDKVEINAK